MKPHEEASDLDLLRLLQAGDERALDRLIERKSQPLYQTAYRVLHDQEEAKDVVQMAFLKIWENRDRFDERWSPNTWIFRICTNLAIDHLRARGTRERSTEPVRCHLRQVADNRSEWELSKLQEGEVMGIFRELAETLTEKQKAVFVLRELQGRSSKEVAEIVGCRESTVRNHLFNARKVLREELLERYPEYAGASRRARAEMLAGGAA